MQAEGRRSRSLRPLHVTVVQIAAGLDQPANLHNIRHLLAHAPPTDLIALPEVFAFRGADSEYGRVAEPLEGPLTKWLAQLAREKKAWVLGGSIIEKARGGPYNTSLLFDRGGRLVARYRKIHLFEATLDDGVVVREATAYRAGSTPTMATIENWRCGLSICYDLRFPELFRLYSARGSHILFVPSNFTQRTGRSHWEILTRARAIENQCFVVAPNQCGSNPATKVISHGHSMIVGPWGEILCQASTSEAVISAVLDPKRLLATRARIPALKHRRL